MITSKTYKALSILIQNGKATSREFAKEMWTDDPKWKLKGNHDKQGGYKLVYAGGNYLARLYRQGLVLRWRPYGDVVHWKISEEGKKKIDEYLAKNK
jgi:hypothetical protein